MLIHPNNAKAQVPGITTGVNKQGIVIGEPFKYRVQATFPENTYTVNWLNIPDSLAHFEVIERSDIDSSVHNGMLEVQQIITLTSFDSGLRTIPPFLISLNPATDARPIKLLTDSVQVRVSFSPMDTTKTFHDIKPIIDIRDEWPAWLWAAAALSLLLVIFLSWYLVKKLRKKTSQPVFNSKLSPLEEANHAMIELQRQQLLNKQEIKQFHSRLTDIFKRYLSRKTNTTLDNLTSEQILLRLGQIKIDTVSISLVAGNLRLADAVKFAKYTPDNILSEEALVNNRKVIEQIDKLIIPQSDI